MHRYPYSLLVDSGFWFAYYEPRDRFHSQAIEKAVHLENASVLLPWPSLYETLNTRFVKRPEYIQHFESIAQRPSVVLLDDTPFREDAYRLTWSMALRGGRPLSLVDMVIRFMLDDVNTRIDYMLTFNVQDFHDICRKHSITML